MAVSIPSAAIAAGLVARLLVPARAPWRPLPPVGGAGGPASGAGGPAGDAGTTAPWLVLAFLVVAVELASYFHGGPRSLYPTISSSTETVFRYRPVKAAAFFGWLAGGCYLVRR